MRDRKRDRCRQVRLAPVAGRRAHEHRGGMCAKSLTFAKHCGAAAQPLAFSGKHRAPDRAPAPAALNRIIRFSRGDAIISGVETPENWTTISSDTHFADDHLYVVTERVGTPHQTDAHAWTIV